MTDQKLVDELEKALTDEAYDGGMGALSGEEFSELVRTLAVTAAEVVEKANTPTNDERDGLAKAMCAIETRSKAATLEEVQAGIQRWTRHRYEADRLIGELADYGLILRSSEPQGEPSSGVSEPQSGPPRCAKCGRPVEFYRDEIGIHPKHVFPFAFHFAELSAAGGVR